MRVLFTLAAFLSSALLFMVEPLAARMILPTFGGSPQVWNTSLVFFQIALLLGYLYAHMGTRRIPDRTQRALQIAVLIVAALVLPMSTRTAWFAAVREQAAHAVAPAPLVLLALAGLVGLPFFALSANSSLLQRWYAASGARDAENPYFLYAAGNVGSMLSLLAYPLLVEPALPLSEQTRFWAFGYVALVIVLLACAAIRPHRTFRAEAVVESASREKPSGTAKGRWLAYSAVPSALLIGVTTYLTSNVAPVPLLWVVPLALYLLTFILVFARKPLAPISLLGRLYPLVLTPLALTIVLEADKPLVPLAGLHLATFFLAAWLCHSQLSLSRPEPSHLTEFYFYVALGGVVGGAFGALLAPVLFNTWFDYPVALVAAALLRPAIPFRSGEGVSMGRVRSWWRHRNADYAYPLIVGAITIALVLAVQLGPSLMAGRVVPGMPPGPERTFLVIGLPLILAFAALDRPVRYGLSLLAYFALSTAFHTASEGKVIDSERTFFGVHRVLATDRGRFHKLVHGNTIHGIQDLQNPRRPLTYYYPTGPIGKVMSTIHPPRVALVGLGVGSLAAYGTSGQRLTYFEIDPTVARIATDPRYFTFIRDSQAKVNIVLGDARLTLARSPDTYGLIVLDAFSSDAIPVHLLTEEAIASYLRHLEPGGLLAFHISNRYLDLEPILAAAARDLKLTARVFIDAPTADEAAAGKTQSHWVLMARRQEGLGQFAQNVDWGDLEDPAPRAWTDDYSNVLGAFHPDD